MAGKKGMKHKEKVMYDPYNFAKVAEKFKADQQKEKEKAKLEAKQAKERAAKLKQKQQAFNKVKLNQRKITEAASKEIKSGEKKLKKSSKKLEKFGEKKVIGPLGSKVRVRVGSNITGGAPGLDKGIRSKMYIGKKFSNGGSMKNKSKGKVVKYTGKHKLDKYLTRDQIKKLDPFGVDLLLQIQEGANKPKKKKMGGAIMKNRGGTFKGVY